jgi:probable O-glycosylation ligase (exosortase A-associated)
MIRDLLLLGVLCGTIPLIVRAPFIGLLAWLWVSLMNPHREVFGFLHGASLNLYLGVLTALAWLASRDRKLISPNPFTILLVAFACWASISAYFALDREHAFPIWDRTIKTIVLGLAVTMLANTRARLQAVIWIMAISLGYYAVKGAGFVVLSGGRNHVFGPESSMIEDNNALGLALIVLLPLLNYLRLTSARALVRWSLLAVMAAALIAILGTYSRGALIALAAAGAVYSLRSRNGLAVLLAAAVVAWALPNFLPTTWFERMSSIQSADADSSFQDRLAAWRTSFNIASAHPLLGGGFVAVEQDWVARTYSSPGSLPIGRAAHSIYFEVLGETGFVGLALYLSAVAAAILNTFRVLGAARGRPELNWASALARMLQVSIGAFLAGGAALSMAYYDGVIVMLSLTAVLLEVVKQATEGRTAASVATWKIPAPTVAVTKARWRLKQPTARTLN